MVCSLYVVSNRVNRKCYVGWTGDQAQQRWNEHCQEAKRGESERYFCKAIRKYGREGFDWEVIQTFHTKEEAIQAEIYWIAELKRFGIELYNLTEGGEGTVGWKPTDEQRRQMSIARSGEGNSMWGKSQTEESKRKNSEAQYKLMRFGDNHSCSRLSTTKAADIRSMRATDNYTIKQLADAYGVSNACIEDVLYNRKWQISEEEHMKLEETRQQNKAAKRTSKEATKLSAKQAAKLTKKKQ